MDGGWESGDPLFDCGVSEEELRTWMRDVCFDSGRMSFDSGDNGWCYFDATASEHERIAEGLEALRTRLCQTLRVRWRELDFDDGEVEWPAVLDTEAVDRLLASTRVISTRTGTTIPGRGVLLRDRDGMGRVVDMYVDEVTIEPQVMPIVVVQYSGAELLCVSTPEANGDFDVVYMIHEDLPAPPQKTTFPLGEHVMDLPVSSYTSNFGSARVPEGGGVLLSINAPQQRVRWLLTVERIGSRVEASANLRSLGRARREGKSWFAEYVSRPRGVRGGDVEQLWPHWPWFEEEVNPLEVLDELILLTAGEVIDRLPFIIGNLLARGSDADAEARLESLLISRSKAASTYQVEVRVRRAARSNANAKDPSPRATVFEANGTVRAGDSFTSSSTMEEAYVGDVGHYSGNSISGPSAITAPLDTGASVYVRCLPTRSSRIDLTCRFQFGEALERTSVDVPLTVVQVDLSNANKHGHGDRRASTARVTVDLPRHDRVEVRSKRFVEPGQWCLMGTTSLAESADELAVWVRVIQVAD